MEVKEIIELMKAVSDNGLTKFELEQNDMKLVMKREKQIVTVSGIHMEAREHLSAGTTVYSGDSMVYTNGKRITGAENAGIASEEAQSFVNEPAGNVIKCPLVGTFYSSPSPEAEAFVKVGDHVKKGQIVAIVEAMKLMNEIESEFDGVVEAVLVDNESTVEYGQPLFRIR